MEQLQRIEPTPVPALADHMHDRRTAGLGAAELSGAVDLLKTEQVQQKLSDLFKAAGICEEDIDIETAPVHVAASATSNAAAAATSTASRSARHPGHYAFLLWAMDCPEFLLLRAEGNCAALKVLVSSLHADYLSGSNIDNDDFPWAWTWINPMTGDVTNEQECLRRQYGHARVLTHLWTEEE
jgi:hypothetical protein